MEDLHPNSSDVPPNYPNRHVATLFFLAFSVVAGHKSMTVLIPLVADARGSSNLWIGVLAGTPPLTLVLTVIPATLYVGAWKRRTVIALGVGLLGVAILGHGIIDNPQWMLLPQVILGLGLGISWPAYLSYFASVVAGERADEMHGRRAAVSGLAILITPVTVTYLAQELGYWGTFLSISMLMGLTLIISLLFMDPAPRPGAVQRSSANLMNAYRHIRLLLKRPAILTVLGLNSVASVLFAQVGGTFLILQLRSLEFSDATVGSFVSISSTSDMLVRFKFGRVVRHLVRVHLLAVSIIAGALLYLVLPSVANPFILGGLLLTIGITAAPRIPAVMGIVSDQLSDQDRDLGMALLIMVTNTANWLAAVSLGALSDRAGLSSVFLVSGSLAIAVTITLALIGRRVAQRSGAPNEMVELWYGQ